MFMRSAMCALGLAGLTAAPGWGADTAFEEKVRDYLLKNPEVIVEALEVLADRERKSALAAQLAQHAFLFEQTALGFGDADAPVQVVEFFDYKCVPCKAVHPRLLDLVQAHPELRIDMRQLPILSPASERAARFALAVAEIAGPAAYTRVHDALWQRKGPMNADYFASLAEGEGLTMAEVEPVMYGDAVSNRIAANRDAAIDLGITGTPAFVTPTNVTVGAHVDALVTQWLSQ